MWPWRRKKQSLREELIEARAKVAHQLLILAAGPADAPRDFLPETEAELRKVLADLDEQIAALKADE